jgi:hypothetical protein
MNILEGGKPNSEKEISRVFLQTDSSVLFFKGEKP